MARGRRWTHNDAPMTIGFDPPRDFVQYGIGQHFIPAAQIKRGLLRLRTQFQCKRWHRGILQLPRELRQRSKAAARFSESEPGYGLTRNAVNNSAVLGIDRTIP